MADDNKNIPPSAGEVAKAIASDDINSTNNNTVQSVDPKSYENAKSTMPDPYEKSNNTVWKIMTAIFAVIAIGMSCLCAWMALNKDEKTKCETAIVDETKEETKEETPLNEDDNYSFTFYRSGIKLKLGKSIDRLNLDYSSSAPSTSNWVERLAIGGLTPNTTGAQNIPSFASGSYEFSGGSVDNLAGEWAPLAFLDVYEKTYYDESILPHQSEDGPALWGFVVYSDDQYVVMYAHPQNIVSAETWETEWEIETTNVLQADLKDSANWSK